VTDTGRGETGSRIMVIGLGNPMLGDDGVGWRVADEVERRLAAARAVGQPVPDVDIERAGVGGIRLMELLTGYESAIIVDAAEFAGDAPGQVRTSMLEEIETQAAGHLDSAHDASLTTALALGRRLGAPLPKRIRIVTIQAVTTSEFSDDLTPEVAGAVPEAAAAVMELLAAVG
jgi:hydrogenase maturation protease